MPSTTRSARGEYAKSAGRRQEILDAAVEVFSGSGFSRGSLRDVADRVGLSQAGLLHHFPSKNRLLEAVLIRRDTAARERMGTPFPEGVDRLRAIIELAAYNATTPDLVGLHVQLSAEAAAPDHPVHDYFVERYEAVVEALRLAFSRADDEGSLRPGVDHLSAARSLTALMDGLQLQWLLLGDSVDMAGDVRRYLESLVTVRL